MDFVIVGVFVVAPCMVLLVFLLLSVFCDKNAEWAWLDTPARIQDGIRKWLFRNEQDNMVKYYTVIQVEEKVLKVMEGLREALTGDDLMETFSWSRDLFFTQYSMTSYPSVWPEERLNEAISLLQQAADATVGTKRHKNCATFPAKFRKHAELTQQRREAFEALS